MCARPWFERNSHLSFIHLTFGPKIPDLNSLGDLERFHEQKHAHVHVTFGDVVDVEGGQSLAFFQETIWSHA